MGHFKFKWYCRKFKINLNLGSNESLKFVFFYLQFLKEWNLPLAGFKIINRVLKGHAPGRINVGRYLFSYEERESRKGLVIPGFVRGFWKVKDHIYILTTVVGRDFPRFHIPILYGLWVFNTCFLVKVLGTLVVQPSLHSPWSK